MSIQKLRMALYARVHTYAPDQVELQIAQHYHSSVGEGQLIPASEYDNGTITLVLEVFEIERDISKYGNLKAADIAVPGLKAKIEQLRADFQKEVNETQARIQNYLALPNETKGN